MPKITKEKFKVFENVFDEFSNRLIFKLISEGYFDGIGSPVSIGKEANIFLGEFQKDINDEKPPVIIKIYRLQACNFNKMYDYIKGDLRYLKLKKQKRQIVFAWAQREYRNLIKARDAGVRVPMPLAVKNHILVLEMIGNNETGPAPRLNVLPPAKEHLQEFFDKTIEYMKKMYSAGIVHADLSEFNILNNDDSPVFIDFSQATLSTHANFKEFLKRDVANVCRFFKKQGLKIDDEEILNRITNKNIK